MTSFQASPAAQLFGPKGQPMQQYVAQNPAKFAKQEPPKLGERYGGFGGEGDISWLPGASLLNFDLSKLTLQDYRVMREHPTISSSLFLLAMMQHQSSWHIEASSTKVAKRVEENIRNIWTDLSRSMSHANWAGYSPNVLQWDNADNPKDGIVLDKIKDLYPEECAVRWKKIPLEGSENGMGQKRETRVFDGIKQGGGFPDVPVGYAFWYPLLMEHGNYAGKKLLKSAFKAWYFSEIIHLYNNRYLERFGEPTPIGRAPFGDNVKMRDQAGRDTTYTSTGYMGQTLMNLRNRSVVILPSEREQLGEGKEGNYLYDLEFLESQMRQADFERYMQRLDEEMSLALFTPILLLRTADVGSYNLGIGHMQMYLWMMNALNADRAKYINQYILPHLVSLNFGKNHWAKIVFTRLGNVNAEMIQKIVTDGYSAGRLGIKIDEIGQELGLTITEIKQLGNPDDPANKNPKDPKNPDDTTGDGNNSTRSSADSAAGKKPSKHSVAELRNAMVERARQQFASAQKRGEQFTHTVGYNGQVEKKLRGVTDDSDSSLNEMYAVFNGWSAAVTGVESYKTADDYAAGFAAVVDAEFAKAGMVDEPEFAGN